MQCLLCPAVPRPVYEQPDDKKDCDDAKRSEDDYMPWVKHQERLLSTVWLLLFWNDGHRFLSIRLNYHKSYKISKVRCIWIRPPGIFPIVREETDPKEFWQILLATRYSAPQFFLAPCIQRLVKETKSGYPAGRL